MRSSHAILLSLVVASATAQAPPEPHAPLPRAGLRLPEIRLHDPYVLVDESTRTYHLYTSASARATGRNRTGTFAYRSRDLATWEGPFLVFECPDDSWAVPQVNAWAPEVHAYRGKYYLFTTLHNPDKLLPPVLASERTSMRSTAIAVSDSPAGPFALIKKDGPVAPPELMTLDGTLYVDPDGKPWMVYAHEWIQKIDGTIEALPLDEDLSAAAGDPIFLFKGSDAPWIHEQAVPSPRPAVYVTDGPQLFRTRTGRLLMLWSSYEKNGFGRDGYVQAIARSKSDSLAGPWEQLPPLVRNDSGHGMLFRTFEGQLMLVVHQPFVNARGKLYEIEDLGDSLRVGRYRDDLSGPPLGAQPGQAPRAVLPAAAGLGAPFPVSIEVDAGRPVGEMKPIWRFFGADEPNYATMKDGRRLLAELGALRPGEVYFRAHNLLCSGDGTPALKWGSTNIYTEDAAGRPVYDWTVVDRIFDSYVSRGVRPFAQLGFMPRALSTRSEPYQHEWRPGLPYDTIITGWAYPPKDYDRWRELAYEWARHCVERYGKQEVESWYWEVWNEANGSYWKGTPEEWYKLHDYAVDGIRRALPTARVGGPHVAGSGGAFMDGFLEHVARGTNHATGRKGTPTDFLAFHAKGAPTFVDGHVRMGLHAQLKAIDSGFRKIAAVPELRAKPIVIGESDPDGCAACQGPQLGYRAGTMYSSYTAAAFARKYQLADRHGVNLEGALTWAFEFEDQPYFAGQRVLASNGIALPVMNVFRMFSRMGGRRVATRSSAEVPLDALLRDGVRGAPDVAALAGLDGQRLGVMVWHYHDDDVPGPAARVELALVGLPVPSGTARLTRFQIDQDHGNAYAAWQRMGSPGAPSAEQYAALAAAGQLAAVGEPEAVALVKGSATLTVDLPRQGVALLVLEMPSPGAER